MEYNASLVELGAKRICRLLDETQEENERRVWAFSKRFEKRIVIMLRLKRHLETCVRWSKGSSDEMRSRPLLQELESLISTFLDIAEMQTLNIQQGWGRPSMVEYNKTWFSLIDEIYEFAHSRSFD